MCDKPKSGSDDPQMDDRLSRYGEALRGYDYPSDRRRREGGWFARLASWAVG